MIDYKTYSKFYNPDKERIYGGIKEQKKEIEQELKEMKKTDLKWRKNLILNLNLSGRKR